MPDPATPAPEGRGYVAGLKAAAKDLVANPGVKSVIGLGRAVFGGYWGGI